MKMAEQPAQTRRASGDARLWTDCLNVSSRMTTSRLLIIAGLFAVVPASLAAPTGSTGSKAPVKTSTKIPLVSTLSPARPQDGALTGLRPSRAKSVPGSQTPLRATAFKTSQFSTITRIVKVGHDKYLRVAQNADVSLPTSSSAPTQADQDASVSKMGKVIKVPDLTLPPLAKPLPAWMQSASVRVDRIEKTLPQPAPLKNRLAQNPAAPPMKTAPAPVTSSERAPNQIDVSVSTFVVLLTTTDLQTVAVADPNIADVAVVNSRAVLLNGKTAGTTSLVIVDGQKIRQYSVHVTAAVGTRPDDIASEIAIPGVSVRQVKDAVVLMGEVATPEESQRAEDIAKIYAPKVVNQLVVRGQMSSETGAASKIQDLIGLPNVTVRVSGDTAILSGTVESAQQRTDAEAVARTVAKTVLNQLKLPTITVDQARSILGAKNELPVVDPTSSLSLDAPLVVRESGGQVILEGTAFSADELAQAVATISQTGLTVVNRATVRAATSQDDLYAARVANAIGRPNIQVRGTPYRTVLEGYVTDTNEAVLAEQVARAFLLPGQGQLDNMLKTRNPVQVNVDVDIVELNVTDSRALGVQYGSATLTNVTEVAPTTTIVGGQPVTVPGSQTRTVANDFNQGTLRAGFGFFGKDSLETLDPFRARIDALVSNGHGRVLSNPRTTVLSGRTATFQVGGQIPIPSGSTSNAAGTTSTIVFKDYGILLDIVPNALPNGVTTLRIRTEVSQPDFSTGVTPPGGGTAIPGFLRRSTTTEITVPPNGVVALGGLITADETQNETRVPILSKLPIIGSLFRSKSFRNNKTELVIFVQPRVLPNTLPENAEAYSGVVAVGSNSNSATTLGNPGLGVFNSGTSIVAQ